MTLFDHEYPPGEWTVAGLAEAFADGGPPSTLPPRTDRRAWRAIRDDAPTRSLADRVIAFAEEAVGEPLEADRASHWLNYHDDDAARSGFVDRNSTHQLRLELLAAAECLEDEERFLDGVLDYAWSLCEQTSWTNPTHLVEGHESEHVGGLPRVDAPPERRTIDLRSRMGLVLGQVDHLLGDGLPAGLRERIREEAERKVITPYEANDDFWWMTSPTAQSWNAACHRHCLGTALYFVDDADRLARLAKKAVDNLPLFLNAFGPDGGSVEGPDYWSSGFKQFVQLASMLESRTGGEYSLFDVPIVGEIARYLLRIELSPGVYPAISDSDPVPTFRPGVLCKLGNELDDPELIGLGQWILREDLNELQKGSTVLDLVWSAGHEDRPRPTPAPRDYLSGIQWWIVRQDPTDPDAVAVAAKGGTMAESHNHADIGAFTYHLGGESPIADLGDCTYNTGYFSEGRYSFLPTRSLGHSVPFVRGREQDPTAPRDHESGTPESERGARVTDRVESERVEVLELDIADVYPEEAELESLIRRFEFERETGRLSVSDTADFRAAAGDRWFESNLVSYHPMERTPGGLRIPVDDGRIEVSVVGDAGPDRVWIEHLPDGVPTDYSVIPPTGRDVWRARIGPVFNEDGTPQVELSIRPERAV